MDTNRIILIIICFIVAVSGGVLLYHTAQEHKIENFVNGARMGAYSTMEKYEYCLVRSQLSQGLPLEKRFAECTKLISEDVDAIWPKKE